MDPVTLAIVAAVTAGLTKGAGKVAEKAVSDTYQGLKKLIQIKFGGGGKVPKAIADLEEEPNFRPYQDGLKHRIEASKVHKDPEILQAARSLLDSLKAKPGGAKAIQHLQNVYGDYSAVAGAYGTATVNVNQPNKKE